MYVHMNKAYPMNRNFSFSPLPLTFKLEIRLSFRSLTALELKNNFLIDFRKRKEEGERDRDINNERESLIHCLLYTLYQG